jgi:ketosteroid isomerase-like protein
MADTRVEIVRAAYDAFNRGDYESWLAAYDEDGEFYDLAEAPDTGMLRGHAGLRAWIARLRDALGEGFRFEPQAIAEGDGVFVVDTRVVGVGVASGIPVDMTVYIVLRLRDRKVVWSKPFVDRAEALKAAGVKE